jgi:hypothetical protein
VVFQDENHVLLYVLFKILDYTLVVEVLGLLVSEETPFLADKLVLLLLLPHAEFIRLCWDDPLTHRIASWRDSIAVMNLRVYKAWFDNITSIRAPSGRERFCRRRRTLPPLESFYIPGIELILSTLPL